RAARPARARLAARRRGEGRGSRAGDHARRRSGGADRPRREAGGGVRPQGLDAAGRARAPADRDRLAERGDRPVRGGARRREAGRRCELGAREGSGGSMVSEADRRYTRLREAMARDGLDALVVSGSEYTGFEGAVTYMSGFSIVRRYAYVLLPLE